MAQAITAPGDVILVPNPTYPIHEFGFIMSGGVIRHLAGTHRFSLHDRARQGGEAFGAEAVRARAELPREPHRCRRRSRFLPRGRRRSREKHELIVLSDLAYAEIYFEGNPPPSILEVPGAMDIAVEFTTLSKTYAMPGWRMGFAVGNERLIGALARVKSYLDYGAFTPIQVAGAAALNGPQDCVDEIRADLSAPPRLRWWISLTRAGWPIPSPPATMFAWAPIPEMFSHLGSLEFSKLLIEEAERGGLARHRLRRVRRRLCADRAGRERAAHPPGGAQYPQVPL